MEIRNSQEQTEQLSLFPEASICSSAELPVSPSQSPESVREWGGQADLPSILSGFLGRCVPGGLSGKTCRGRFQAGRVDSETSTFSSTNMQNAGMLVLGAYSTLNMCEWTGSLVPFLKEDGVCSLSDILEPSGNIPLRYFLSPTACLGILRRAESRGKALPEILRIALEKQAADRGTQAASTRPSTSATPEAE